MLTMINVKIILWKRGQIVPWELTYGPLEMILYDRSSLLQQIYWRIDRSSFALYPRPPISSALISFPHPFDVVCQKQTINFELNNVCRRIRTQFGRKQAIQSVVYLFLPSPHPNIHFMQIGIDIFLFCKDFILGISFNICII